MEIIINHGAYGDKKIIDTNTNREQEVDFFINISVPKK